MSAHQSAFQQLKPICVALAQALLNIRKGAHPSHDRELVTLVSALLRILQSIPSELSPKLAEYCLFPLGQLLDLRQLVSVQALELSLQCLVILISHGWQSQISPKLYSLLITPVTFLADVSAGRQNSVSVSDDLRQYAFQCMHTLFTAVRTNYQTRSALTEFDHIPQLGHAVTVILEGVASADSATTQLQAAQALGTLLPCLDDHDALANFLPGVVSTLTKVLTPSTQSRRSWKLLVACLEVLTDILWRTVSDVYTIPMRQTGNILIAAPGDQANAAGGGPKKQHDAAWLKASAGQIKLALANINRLHNHDRSETRRALFKLNYMILIDCGESMPNCRPLALEAAIAIAELDDDGDDHEGLKSRLVSAAETQSDIADLLQSTFYNWSMSMDRVMAGADDRVKERYLQHIFSAFSMIYDERVSSSSSVRLMASVLLDGVVSLIRLPSIKSSDVVKDLGLLALRGHQGISEAIGKAVRPFNGRMAHSTSQQAVLDTIKQRINALKNDAAATALANSLLDSLSEHDVDNQVAVFWLLVSILKRRPSDATAEFLAIDDGPSGTPDSILHELYSRSLVLVADEDSDWRLQALSLESLALQAEHSGPEFRPELIDALYPVLFLLGSPTAQVRDNAVVCLDIFASTCQYNDVKDLIVSNVDYLVNAVALKLNSFDISPQAPQVLLMMVRLAGPSLLPYLEDTIESIFAALEDYHGYPLLVELLFSVLKAMAEEGVKAPHLAIEATSTKEERFAHDWTPITVSELASRLGHQDAPEGLKEPAIDAPNGEEVASSMPEPTDVLDSDKPLDLANLNTDGEIPADISPDPPPKLSKSYNLVHKITQLTQHYLSSSSPSLRTSLLSLIKTTIPALANGDEDTYLPLVNTLWPELVSRLEDVEPRVVGATLDVLGVMCQFAGDFMRSRIRDLWDEVERLVRRLGSTGSRSTAGRIGYSQGPAGGHGQGHSQGHVQGHAQGHVRVHGQGQGVGPMHALTLRTQDAGFLDTSTKVLMANITTFLILVVEHVGIEAAMFDAVLGWLSPLSKLEEAHLRVLRKENGDAVWLALWKEGLGRDITLPRSSGGWRFVPVLSV